MQPETLFHFHRVVLLRALLQALVGLRATYLASHLEQLRPFIAPK
jgi:hypothetical protein